MNMMRISYSYPGIRLAVMYKHFDKVIKELDTRQIKIPFAKAG